MRFPRRVGALVLVAALCGCGDDAASPVQVKQQPAPAPAARQRSEPSTPRDPRLREDCGGWEPAADLLDVATKLGDVAAKKDALAALDAAPAARRIDVLRAGLRLADDIAARACAARLKYQWIDNWECARCVDLLLVDVVKPGTEADFEEFRSYLGSVELTRFLRALPPLPWKSDPPSTIGALHRIIRSSDAAGWLELTQRPEREIADTAWSEFCATALGYDDALLSVFQAHEMRDDGGRTPTGPGLPPVYRRCYRDALDGKKWDVDWFDRRILYRAVPAAADADMLCDAAERLNESDPIEPGGMAMLLLGRLHDERGAALLGKLAFDENEDAAWLAFARRGDAKAVDHVEAKADEDAASLACLMESAPDRARKHLDARLLGDDEAAAQATLALLEEFTPPGAQSCALGFDWRRTSFDGFEAAALAKARPALRLARIGVVVPGCRTRRVAEAAANRLAPGDLSHDGQQDLDPSQLKGVGAFLETAAPDAARLALRRISASGGDDAERATRWGVRLGDPEAAARFVSAGYAVGWLSYVELARTRATEVGHLLEPRLRAWLDTGAADERFSEEIEAFAVLNGLPEDAVSALDEPTRAVVEAVLAGRPVDAVAAVLAAKPDDEHGDVGAIDDPRVRAYLERLRARRDLGLYWYATGQLAAMGDSAARADYWGAMQDGRYRIMDDANAFERTLGWNLAATMPFWISEARSNCCRATTSGVGDIIEDVFGGIQCFNAIERTGYERAKELWDAAGGRFVKSRIAGHWVPEPR